MNKGNINNVKPEEFNNISPYIKDALNYIKNNDIKSLENGTYEIIKDKVKVIVSDYHTKEYDSDLWEAHKSNIDVQYIAAGSEKIYYTDVSSMPCIKEYDSNKDIAFYRGNADTHTVVNKGDFMILLPEDAHMPGIIVDSSVYVKKAIIKIRI